MILVVENALRIIKPNAGFFKYRVLVERQSIEENLIPNVWGKLNRIIMMDRKTKVMLIKGFSYGEKVIYSGTLRKARKLIPPSKKDQYIITNLETGKVIK